MPRSLAFRLLLITDRRLCAPRRLEDVVDAAIWGGVDAVMLREKDLGGRALLALARALRAVTAGRARLLVSDRLDVARASGADGVHLPSAGFPPSEARAWLGAGAIVGYSTHGARELAHAAAEGVDYATLSPVWAPRSKLSDLVPLGPEGFAALARDGSIPLVALGGIEASNAAAARAAGARAVAVIGAVMGAEDPAGAARALRSAFEAAGGGEGGAQS